MGTRFLLLKFGHASCQKNILCVQFIVIIKVVILSVHFPILARQATTLLDTVVLFVFVVDHTDWQDGVVDSPTDISQRTEIPPDSYLQQDRQLN